METTEKTVRAFELEDHGTDHAQYFPGAGIALTDFEDIGTGVGNTPAQALEDALEVLAMSGWNIPEDVERELREELGPAEHAERDYVSELESEGIEDALPREEWTLHAYSWSGCHGIPEDFETEDSARVRVAERIRELRRAGFPVSVSKRGSKWEVHEPEGCSLVPDDCGELVLDSNEEEREELRSKLEENGSELHYYVSVRVARFPIGSAACPGCGSVYLDSDHAQFPCENCH